MSPRNAWFTVERAKEREERHRERERECEKECESDLPLQQRPGKSLPCESEKLSSTPCLAWHETRTRIVKIPIQNGSVV